ncbi:hypothetical protein DFH09DRAFT_1294262 [Mycena vulgaris]|nr:hypothetical protein DFH09DRAFT_1294262 [Mycena vulgaris]
MRRNKLILTLASLSILSLSLCILARTSSSMPRQIAPFLCSCGCGEVKSKATELRHLGGHGVPFYIQYSQQAPLESSPEPHRSPGDVAPEMDIDNTWDDTGMPSPNEMDIEDPPELADVSDSESESDDGFFAGEDEQDGGWDSDEEPEGESDAWEEGEEPWQQGPKPG